MAGNDYVFRKSMETSESAVSDSGKDNIDPKRSEDEEMQTYIGISSHRRIQ